ncbi:ectomycorrhiza-upregulated zf-MYND domain-containing protein [Trametopsis cervina]|nr:ectomycorrhiza-upregulated zf-MYND domain-containing protein [Trametopsis cervina]
MSTRASDEPLCQSCGTSYEVNQRCSRCKTVTYCSQDCQKKHWTIHKPICRVWSPSEVWAIKVLSSKEAGCPGSMNPAAQFQHFLLNKQHPAFSRAELCTSTKAYGLPLRIYSPAIANGEEGSGNQLAVYLRIEPDNGFAPMHWQMNDPGTCIVFREDHKPLTREVLEAVWKFHATLLGSVVWETDKWVSPMNPATWQFFVREYYDEQRQKGREGFPMLNAPP